MFMKTMTAGKFKAQCLKVIDRVDESREPVTISKKGRAIAKLVPIGLPKEDFWGPLAGIIEIVGEIEAPVQPAEDWNALR
jgi:prevent-host-death family protein